MIPLVIICSLFFLVFCLTFFPINFKICYEEKFYFEGRYLFFSFKNKEDKKQKKSEKKKKEDNKKEKKKPIKIKENIKSNGLLKTIFDLFDLVTYIFSKLGSAVRHIVIKKLWFEISVSGEDAASAAIKYGRVCAVFYPAIGIIEQKIKKVKNQDGSINCLYDNSDSVIKFNISGYIKPIFLILPAISIIIKLIKSKIIKGTVKENER